MFAQSENGHPADASPCTTPDEVDEFLSYALDSYDIDVNRVYLTGLSCGGYAIYEYLAQFGDADVAAVIPIAADARPAWDAVGCALGETPTWAFIGDVDDVVEPQGTIEPIAALRDCTDPAAAYVELTVYPGVDHASWVATYDLSAGNDIYSWLLELERSD
jgi:predicted peptidase